MLVRSPKLSLKFPLLVCLSLLTAIAAVIFAVGKADALQAMLKPNNPALGDTVSVWIATNQASAIAPTVSVDRKQFPVFPMSPNRWRAFIPTTPLDKAGLRQVIVTGEGFQQTLPMVVGDRQFP
ncbi:MAG: M23 family peptidase, partial [Pseudanabaena sp.]